MQFQYLFKKPCSKTLENFHFGQLDALAVVLDIPSPVISLSLEHLQAEKQETRQETK